MTENVVYLVCLWMFKIISGCLKRLKESEMRLTLNHLAGDLTCNKELVNCSFYHNMFNWVSVNLFSLGICSHLQFYNIDSRKSILEIHGNGFSQDKIQQICCNSPFIDPFRNRRKTHFSLSSDPFYPLLHLCQVISMPHNS